METFKCLNCNKENFKKKNHFNKYCDNTCQGEHKFLTETLPKFKKGEISTMRTLHKCVKALHGYKCQVCGNEGSYNGKILSLQLDHIDGKASNNNPINLRLLCPNCHSQTDTYVSKNKGNSTRVR
jgi:5-methylcytosine-specific restriction endonuclease McrA